MDSPTPAAPGSPDDADRRLPVHGPITLAEALAAVARRVPPGCAVSYGALAGILGRGGPRQAGRAMAESDRGTPWWRVVRADGSLPADLAARAAVEHAREGTPLRSGGRVDLDRARWEPDPAAWAAVGEIAARVG